jgi:GH24 family phage-related lysozyme (muramidase)
MSAVDLATSRLATEEGFRALKYLDSRGLESIGYGFNITAGISKYAATALLSAQVTELDTALAGFPWYQVANDVRKSVFLDIAMNAGPSGLLHFPHMLAAAATGDWEVAAAQCQVKEPELASRYAALAQLLLTGVPS